MVVSFLFSPLVITSFCFAMVALVIIHGWVKDRMKRVVALVLHGLSVFGFFAFLFYFHAALLRSCSVEVTQTIVGITVFFVTLTGLFFYYLGRKRI